jgi:hypothetical protein
MNLKSNIYVVSFPFWSFEAQKNMHWRQRQRLSMGNSKKVNIGLFVRCYE